MKKIILILVVLLTLIPLLNPGLFNVHDPTSIIRFATLRHALGDGQLPAAWTNELNHGYGYPLFLYYAPVFSYLGVLLSLITPSYLLALKLALLALVSVASLGMYKLMRQFVDSYSSLVSAVAYTLLPYHASTLYVRGSYAEGVTWALLPWLMYFWSQTKTDYRWIAKTSLLTALFFLSHNSLPFAFIPFLFLWIVMFKRTRIIRSVATLGLSLTLTLAFLLPVLFERGLVQVDHVATLTKYSDHFVSLSQLWHSPWGYGGSSSVGEVDGMSFMLGKFQLVLAFLTLFVVTWRQKWSRPLVYFLGLLVFYAFMTTASSLAIWQLLPTLSILQFPWRLLSFASFGLAAIVGYSLEIVPAKFKVYSAVCLSLLLLFFNLKFFTPERIVSLSDSEFISQEKLDTLAATKIPEYLPTTMPTFPTSRHDDGLTRTPTTVSGTLVLPSPGPLELGTAYMPQWQLRVDDQVVKIHASSDGKIETIDQWPVGEYQLDLTWHPTVIERLGSALSLLSIVVVIGLLFI